MQVRQLAHCERQATVQLVASLIEMDTRRLCLGEGCSSLFTYCTRVLRLSEHAAYGRIEAARAARRFPVILDLLGDGAITLTTVGLLASHLTPENHAMVLESARHKTKREVERLVAELSPRPAVATVVRKLPVQALPALVSGVDVPAPPAETAAATKSSTLRGTKRGLRWLPLSHRSSTKFSSLSLGKRTTSSGAFRTCFGIRFTTVMQPKYSTAR